MCKKRTELFIKLASKYKVNNMEDLKDLFIKGFEAVGEDSSESHKELSEKISEMDKKIDDLGSSMQQIIEHIIKPKGKVLEFLGSKKFLISVIVALVITMLSGVGVMGLLNKSSNISEIVKSIK